MKLLILTYSLVISPNSGNIYGRQMIWESTRQILSATLSASSLSARSHWFVDLNLQSQTCSFDFLQLFRQLLSARWQLLDKQAANRRHPHIRVMSKKLVIFWILHSSVKEATGKTTLKYAHFTPDFLAFFSSFANMSEYGHADWHSVSQLFTHICKYCCNNTLSTSVERNVFEPFLQVTPVLWSLVYR